MKEIVKITLYLPCLNSIAFDKKNVTMRATYLRDKPQVSLNGAQLA